MCIVHALAEYSREGEDLESGGAGRADEAIAAIANEGGELIRQVDDEWAEKSDGGRLVRESLR